MKDTFIEIDDDLTINVNYIYSIKKYMEDNGWWVLVITYKDGTAYVLKSNKENTISIKYDWVQRHLFDTV